MSCDWNARGHVDVLLDVGRRPARRRSAGSPASRRSAAATTRSCATGRVESGQQLRLPYGTAERTGRSTATNPGCAAEPVELSTAAIAGWPLGTTSAAAQPRVAVEPLGDEPVVHRRRRAPRRRRGCGSSRRRSRRSGSPSRPPAGRAPAPAASAASCPGAAPSTAGKSPSDVARFGGWAWSVGPENCVVESTSRQWSSRCGSRTARVRHDRVDVAVDHRSRSGSVR